MIVSTVFNPLSYEQIARPLIEMTNTQHQVEEAYAQDDEKSSGLESFLDPNLDKESYNKYATYRNNLIQARDSLYKNGLQGPATMNNLMNIKHLYNKEIMPLATKAKFRQDQINLEQQAHLKDPSVISNIDYSKQSLDNIDLKSSNSFVSGNQFAEEALKKFLTIAQSKVATGELTKVAGMTGDYLKKMSTTTGFGEKVLQDVFKSGTDANELFKQTVKDLEASYGLDKWTGNNADNARELAEKNVAKSVYALVGTTTNTMYNDELLMDLLKMEAEHKASQQLPDLTESGDPSEVSVMLGGDKSAVPEYTKTAIKNIRDRLFIKDTDQINTKGLWGNLFDANGKFIDIKPSHWEQKYRNLERNLEEVRQKYKVSYSKAAALLVGGQIKDKALTQDEKDFLISNDRYGQRINFVNNTSQLRDKNDVKGMTFNALRQIVKNAENNQTAGTTTLKSVNYENEKENVDVSRKLLDNVVSKFSYQGVKVITGTYKNNITTSNNSTDDAKKLDEIVTGLSNGNKNYSDYHISFYLNPNNEGIILRLTNGKDRKKSKDYLITNPYSDITRYYKDLIDTKKKLDNDKGLTKEQKELYYKKAENETLNRVADVLNTKQQARKNSAAADKN